MHVIEHLPLETERLMLRRYTLADAPAIHRINSTEEVTRYLPFGPMMSEEDARSQLERFFLGPFLSCPVPQEQVTGIIRVLHDGTVIMVDDTGASTKILSFNASNGKFTDSITMPVAMSGASVFAGKLNTIAPVVPPSTINAAVICNNCPRLPPSIA